jgi:hypothetical protein
MADNITNEMIAARAYARFVERNYQHGNDVEDWLAAEGDLREELGRIGQKTVRRTPARPTPTRAAKTAKRS